MNLQTQPQKNGLKKLAAFVFSIIPFCTVVFLILVITFFLTTKISAKKTDINGQQIESEAYQKRLTNVVTMTIEPSLIQETISLPGAARPWIIIEAAAEVRGKIIKKTVEDGDPVNKGDIIAVIDERDYQNAYKSALASYETAKTKEKRLTALIQKGIVTQSQLDDAVARVKTDKATVDNALLSLNRCTIRSPIKGIINRIHIEKGSFLNPGDSVAQILQIDRLKVEVGIPESDVDAVRKLNSFELVIDALDGKKYTGTFHHLCKTTDSFARLYNLEIKVENPDLKILPDMFVRVNIIKKQDPEGLAVPMYAMVNQDNQIGVFAEKDGTVHFRPVAAGFITGSEIQIKNGLEPNDQVVVIGHRLIKSGDRVNVTKVIDKMEELSK